MTKILDHARPLYHLLSFSKRPINSSQHGPPEVIAQRGERRNQASHHALARTAGSGSIEKGVRELADARHKLDELIRWAAHTAQDYSRPAPPDDLRELAFGALHAFEQYLDKPGIGRKAGEPDSPAIRFLTGVFRQLRHELAMRSELGDLAKLAMLSPTGERFLYWIVRYKKRV